jgi:hypothetical protein
MALSARLLRPRASGGGFDPRSIANCALWLDASVNSSLTFNGNTVSEWRDLSGNGRHFSQGTAAFQPNGVNRTQNGKRVLDFQGNQVLIGNAATLNTIRNVPGATAVCAIAFDATGANGVVFNFSIATNASTARFQIGQASSVGGTYCGGRRLDANTFASAFYADNTNPRIQSGVLDYANSDAFIWENGTLQNSNTSFQTTGNCQDADHAGVTIGNNSAVLTDAPRLDGWIGEILVWPRALTTAERLAVERYMGAKWGIAVT